MLLSAVRRHASSLKVKCEAFFHTAPYCTGRDIGKFGLMSWNSNPLRNLTHSTQKDANRSTFIVYDPTKKFSRLIDFH